MPALKFEISFDPKESSPVVIKLKKHYNTPSTLEEVIKSTAAVTLSVLEKTVWVYGEPDYVRFLEVTFKNRENGVIAVGTLATNSQGSVEEFLIGVHYGLGGITEFNLEPGSDNTVNLTLLKITTREW